MIGGSSGCGLRPWSCSGKVGAYVKNFNGNFLWYVNTGVLIMIVKASTNIHDQRKMGTSY